MDEQERHATRTARDAAVAERARLDVVIAYLSERLGEPPPSGGGGGLPLMGQTANLGGGDPVAGTHEGEYYGESSTDAAYKVLGKFGNKQHLLKTKDLFDAVRKGGVAITSEEGFYKSLSRSHRFKKIGRGTWGLSEWYPAAAKKAAAARGDLGNVATLGATAHPNGAEPVSSDDEVHEEDTA